MLRMRSPQIMLSHKKSTCFALLLALLQALLQMLSMKSPKIMLRHKTSTCFALLLALLQASLLASEWARRQVQISKRRALKKDRQTDRQGQGNRDRDKQKTWRQRDGDEDTASVEPQEKNRFHRSRECCRSRKQKFLAKMPSQDTRFSLYRVRLRMNCLRRMPCLRHCIWGLKQLV